MLPSILCVDDEPKILEGLALQLRRDYEVHTAANGIDALEKLKTMAPPAVVVSDMRMPGMDGAALLKNIMHLYPETSRILLTSEPGRDAPIIAIAECQVFKFLAKPCAPDALRAAAAAGVSHYELKRAEKVLLQHTLIGCIKALIDVLAMTNPVAFGRANRVKRMAVELATAMGHAQFWQLEAAAMLSQIGYVSLPVELVEKLYYGGRLTAEEQALADGAPRVAQKLLGHIPRMEQVLEIIAGSQQSTSDKCEGLAKLGADILRAVLAYEALLVQGQTMATAFQSVRSQLDRYNRAQVETFATSLGAGTAKQIVREVALGQVRPGMIFLNDLHTHIGTLLVPKGFEVTEAFLERLRNFGPGALVEKVQVRLR
jgi:CheY-like chemotaxis protein